MEFWTPTFATPTLSADFARRAEAVGWDGMLVVDSQNLWGDPYVCLALAGAVTERLGLATSVTDPVTRYPAATASSALSLQVQEQLRKVPDLDGQRRQLGSLAGFRGLSVAQRAIDAYPRLGRGLSSANQFVSAALCERVKQRVVGRAHGTTKIRPRWPSAARRDQPLRRGEEVRSVQVANPWRRPSRLGASRARHRRPCPTRCLELEPLGSDWSAGPDHRVCHRRWPRRPPCPCRTKTCRGAPKCRRTPPPSVSCAPCLGFSPRWWTSPALGLPPSSRLPRARILSF